MTVAAAGATSFRGSLKPREYFWRDHQPWLESRGYTLRARYKPDWTPSWKGTKKSYLDCDDGQELHAAHLLDAVRTSDGKLVMLKKISKKVHQYEAEISQMFSSPELANDPRNHCIPIFDVLQDPDDEDTLILAMPLLRQYDDPKFGTVGEAVEFLHQIFEGLQFMHQRATAHRDCMNLNVMMDPSGLYPNMFHPQVPWLNRNLKGYAKHFTRTERPTKYYLIDFGLALHFEADETRAAYPILGGDKSVPEFRDTSRLSEPQDPFPTDIYYLGNLVREDFLQRYHGLDFLDSLVADMVQDDPTKRPNMDDVVARFEEIRSKLKCRTLRSRLVARREDWVVKLAKDVRHVYRTAKCIIRRYPPVPTLAS